MTAIPTATGFDIGRVISRLFGVLGRNFVAFLMLALLLVGLPTAASSLLQLIGTFPAFANSGAGADPTGFNAVAFAFLPVSWLIGAMANAVLQGAVIHGTVSDLSGRRVTFGEALNTGLRFFLPLVGVGLIAAVCCFFGYLVFVVPGVLLALAWSVAAPVAVTERAGVFGAFARSAELTRNHRGAIFGLAIIAIVVGLIFQGTATALVALGALPIGASGGALLNVVIIQAVTNLIASTANSLIGSAGVASVYYELRYVKEGIGAQELASVFD
ncbi:MAG: hypothetical protein WDM85_15755 [Caulobacteraceae bacterium]